MRLLAFLALNTQWKGANQWQCRYFLCLHDFFDFEKPSRPSASADDAFACILCACIHYFLCTKQHSIESAVVCYAIIIISQWVVVPCFAAPPGICICIFPCSSSTSSSNIARSLSALLSRMTTQIYRRYLSCHVCSHETTTQRPYIFECIYRLRRCSLRRVSSSLSSWLPTLTTILLLGWQDRLSPTTYHLTTRRMTLTDSTMQLNSPLATTHEERRSSNQTWAWSLFNFNRCNKIILGIIVGTTLFFCVVAGLSSSALTKNSNSNNNMVVESFNGAAFQRDGQPTPAPTSTKSSKSKSGKTSSCIPNGPNGQNPTGDCTKCCGVCEDEIAEAYCSSDGGFCRCGN